MIRLGGMSPEMIQALATATKQWHETTRHYELMSRAFADAQAQLQLAERDLHELARAIEVAQAAPGAQLVTSAATPIGAVTMPVVAPAAQATNATADGVDAAQIVLEQMMQQRMGMP